MKPMTLEWVAKAEGDFAVMERESRVRKNPNYDAVCFRACKNYIRTIPIK